MRFLLVLMIVLSCRAVSRPVSAAVSVIPYSHGQVAVQKPNPVWLEFIKKRNQRKKVIASALAFPVPFGLLGVHRIYLGTRPWIPVVYVGTLGGCAGILPLIDFVTLVSNKDISRFQSNPRIFMWVDNEAQK